LEDVRQRKLQQSIWRKRVTSYKYSCTPEL